MDLTLRGASGDCRILVGPCLEEAARLVSGRRTVVVTDANVERLHRERFPAGEVVAIGTGEASKTLATVEALYRRFVELEVDRSTFVVAVGGGIVCDVAAFAAATFLRGLDCGLVPTTVLAQSDAGVGGKNGVNLGGIKNLVGTIRQPRFVLCDPLFLETLPLEELRSGLAEIVKAGAIADAELFAALEVSAAQLLARDRPALQRAVEGALRVKARVVEADESEKGERRALNFGHTLGHALEALEGMRHGEGVSVGMVFAARLSESRGLLPAGGAERIELLLARLGLPVRRAGDPARWLEAMGKDKKRAGKAIQMALLKSVGECVIAPVELRELEAALQPFARA